MILVKYLNINNVGIPPKGQLSIFRAKDGEFADQLVALHDDGFITPVTPNEMITSSIQSFANNDAAKAAGLTTAQDIYYNTTERALKTVNPA